jgi:ligand-binding sensor domain-containing protein
MCRVLARAAVVCLVAGLLLAPSADVRAEHLPIKTYTTADGLAHNVVNRVVRDSRGFLWFCTREGLSRFDGYSFTNYGIEQGLPSAMVNDLQHFFRCVISAGTIWSAATCRRFRFHLTQSGDKSPHSRSILS